MRDVKSVKTVKKGSFYKAVFNLIKQGKSPSFISKTYKISRQKVYYYTKVLKKEGFIGKTKDGKLYARVKTFSLGTKPKNNLHALNIYIPVSSGNIPFEGWEVKEKLRNWTPRYKKLKILGGITIKNNNNKSISLFAHTRDIEDLQEIDDLARDIKNWAYSYFRKDFNVILDIDKAETKNLHIATQDTHSEGMLKKGEKFELDLDKKAEKIFPPDKIDAKAWLDGSPFSFTAETNDKEWKRAYLNMPFSMQNSFKLLNYIAQNYASHVGIVEKLNKMLEKPKVKKQIKEQIKNKDQTSLTDF